MENNFEVLVFSTRLAGGGQIIKSAYRSTYCDVQQWLDKKNPLELGFTQITIFFNSYAGHECFAWTATAGKFSHYSGDYPIPFEEIIENWKRQN